MGAWMSENAGRGVPGSRRADDGLPLSASDPIEAHIGSVKMKKWTRVTPIGRASSAAPPEASPKSAAANSASVGCSIHTKLGRGMEQSMLYGMANPVEEKMRAMKSFEGKTGGSSVKVAEEIVSSPRDADFKFWQSETLDAKTGRTGDAKILYNMEGEDRGVCKEALVGRYCHRGAQCPFSHPVRQHNRIGKDLYFGMATLSARYDLDIGRKAMVRILHVVAPFTFTMSVLAYCDQMEELDSDLDGENPADPAGFGELMEDMRAYYAKGDSSAGGALPFRTLEDVTDAFVSVNWIFRGELDWFRGIVMGLSEMESGEACLKINLPDIGEHVQIQSPKAIRRLANRFLKEPWFATRASLADITAAGPVTPLSTLKWLRTLLTGKIAWISVADKEFDEPLVDLYTRLDNGMIGCVNDFLVEKMAAVSIPAVKKMVSAASLDETFDGSDEDDDQMNIIPG
ncbi:hypothetical protein BV898_00256 [Hypsibius exemplaris]|uniref:C3H1-type domain-containing protein n=1 Tax=Hypsibius exemplaris TaxID=2072580 RepID=A0A1W0XF80_HYPEX|nr:hypothetical protein BV898_00256 [Hypsibius exemplaris]